MTKPTNTACHRTYRMIQAHCAIRTSAAVGDRLRLTVGEKGDICALPNETLRTMFRCPVRLAEAQRLVALATMNSRKGRRNEGTGEGTHGQDSL